MNEAGLTELPEETRLKYQVLYPGLVDKLRRFDARIYFRSNPDVARAVKSSEDLIRHFCEFGHNECRLYAEGVDYTTLFSEAFPSLATRLRTFSPAAYARANRDVGGPDSTSRDYYEHFCRYGAQELRVSRGDGRVPDRRDALRRHAGVEVTADIQAYCHVFFRDAGMALTPYLRSIVALGGRVAISYSEMTFSAWDIEQFATSVSPEDGPDAAFVPAPTEGRDWGGFHCLWQRYRPAPESVVFFLHSKKSLHMTPIVGEIWRAELLAPICGTYGNVVNAVDKLQSGYSMVGSAMHRSRNVGPSRALIVELGPLLGLGHCSDELEFVAGTMFAVRGQVLNDFFDAIAPAIDFRRRSVAATSFDGSMAHACERLIGYFAATQGRGIAWVV